MVRGRMAAARTRLAFVGQTTFFAACALGDEHPGFETRFVEFRAGGDADRLMAELDAFAPHVVLVFRPEIVPAGLFAGLRATTLGFLTEPIPRTAPGTAHPDLQRRLGELRQVDAGNFDRIVSFDPMIAPTSAAAGLPVWRSVPLPVADHFYAPVRDLHGRPKVIFSGRGTAHRQALLDPVKERFEVLHLAFGLADRELGELMEQHDVGVNLHNEPYPSYENRVSTYLAGGLLVISEPLSPEHGLEVGLDYLVADSAAGLLEHLERMARFPGVFHAVRVRGRRKAELFRASRIYPRLVADLRADVAAFGTQRS